MDEVQEKQLSWKLCPIGFSFQGRDVGIATNQVAVMSKLSSLLNLPLTDQCIHDPYKLIRDEHGFNLIDPKWRATHYPTISDCIVDLAAIIPYALLPHQVAYVIHGGAVVINESAHVFLGPGFIGKSTLAYAAWLLGCEVIGDDYLLLDVHSATVQATPKPMKLRRSDNSIPDYLSSRNSEDRYCVGRREDSWVLTLGRTLAGMAPLGKPYPIKSLYVLERAENGVVCEPAKGFEIVKTLYAQLLRAPRNDLGVARCFSKMIDQGRVSRLGIGMNASFAAAKLLMDKADT